MLQELLANKVLYASLTAWLLAQIIKPPIEFLFSHRWKWSLITEAGGFPSSHTALVVSTAASIGLYYGFDTPIFALSIALAMIISYDAAGVRRQAGLQAQKLNVVINELFKGRPISETQLKEVLGHTRRQVLGGAILGLAISVMFWLLFP